jgi:hypothetical protein
VVVLVLVWMVVVVVRTIDGEIRGEDAESSPVPRCPGAGRLARGRDRLCQRPRGKQMGHSMGLQKRGSDDQWEEGRDV